MLKIYDPLDDYLEEDRINIFLRKPLRHLASELMEEMGYHTEDDFKKALDRTFEVCCTMHIPIQLHFRQVFVYDEQGIHPDWQLTDLGSYLLLVNGSSRNDRVALAQLYFLKR